MAQSDVPFMHPDRVDWSHNIPCVIGQEEITHCAAGVRWFTYLHDLAHSSGSTVSEQQATPDWMVIARQHKSVETWFHELVRTHFRGSLKVSQQNDASCTACVVQAPASFNIQANVIVGQAW